jgi:hypothetical protein
LGGVPAASGLDWYAPIVIPSSPCDTSEQCCVSLHDIAAHLLSEVYDAVLGCYPGPDCCEPLAAYVTTGSGDDGITDSLTVAVGQISASQNTKPGGLGLWKGAFTVRLVESGWPVGHVEGNTIVMPPPDEQARAARHVLSMGEAIHRRLAALQTQRGLTPPGVRCSNAVVGTMIALPPQGGVVGWVVQVTVDLPWN